MTAGTRWSGASRTSPTSGASSRSGSRRGRSTRRSRSATAASLRAPSPPSGRACRRTALTTSSS
eukprot:12983326-Alexandrium_andersonii.AAC.1